MHVFFFVTLGNTPCQASAWNDIHVTDVYVRRRIRETSEERESQKTEK
jgi:hypothetical protein